MSFSTSPDLSDPVSKMKKQYLEIRSFTDQIVKPLSAEDCMVQSMDDASPTRWHMAHTTWFFETFVLCSNTDYKVFDESYNFLFNSYYNTIGKQFPRPQRGFVSRPGLDAIKDYRAHVDQSILQLLESGNLSKSQCDVINVGLNHEQQHQELMLTDMKHVLSCNPLSPAYSDEPFAGTSPSNDNWMEIPEGIYSIGVDEIAVDGRDEDSELRFAFDNESPRHRVFLENCSVSRNLVTCGQFIEFIEDGGYQRPDHWLSLGWNQVNSDFWDSPMYWVKQGSQWMQFTLAGLAPINVDCPVCHVSLFEADAYARWAGHRLPTEFEWEVAHKMITEGQPKATAVQNGYQSEAGSVGPYFADDLFENHLAIHPTQISHDHAKSGSNLGLMGSVWQWTSSSYSAYPGYRAPAGAIGEYNGKFMCNQYVLRGGSVATHSSHIRPTYRNFFPAQTRWQFTGIRLAS